MKDSCVEKYMITEREFLVDLAKRLKIRDMCSLAEAWKKLCESEDAIEKLVQSDEFKIEEKVFLSITLGLDIQKHLERLQY